MCSKRHSTKQIDQIVWDKKVADVLDPLVFWGAKESIFIGLNGFHEEPHDITVYVGQKAHFSCHVDAVPTPRIRWLKDERPLQIDDLRMTILPSGALEIDEVVESDQGSYRHVYFPRIMNEIAENLPLFPDVTPQGSIPTF